MRYRKFIIFCFLLDRISKFLAVKYLSNGSININENISLNLFINHGFALGFLNTIAYNSYIIFLLLSIIIFLVIYTYVKSYNQGSIFAESLVIVGAFSNLIDRIIYNGVIDFIDINIASFHIPVFNLSDFMIVVGILIMFKNIIFQKD